MDKKERYEAIIVVEGKSDVALLQSFLDADFVITNGSDVPEDTIRYLLEASQKRSIVVFTDPDGPGKRIRDILNQRIPNLYHAYLRKEVAIKKNKVGVAESDKESILKALHTIIPAKPSPKASLTSIDMYELGLAGHIDSEAKRKILCDKMNLGHSNGKTILKRLNSLGIDRITLERIINEQR